MAVITSASKVREANDVRYLNIPVPEWGEDAEIRLRSFTARELIAFTSLKGDNLKRGIVKGLVMSAVDEHGEQVFTQSDEAWLMDKNVSVLHRIQEGILVLNGMKKPEEEQEAELYAAGKD